MISSRWRMPRIVGTRPSAWYGSIMAAPRMAGGGTISVAGRPGRTPASRGSANPSATAELARLTVLHLDKDLKMIAEITGQALEHLKLGYHGLRPGAPSSGQLAGLPDFLAGPLPRPVEGGEQLLLEGGIRRRPQFEQVLDLQAAASRAGSPAACPRPRRAGGSRW